MNTSNNNNNIENDQYNIHFNSSMIQNSSPLPPNSSTITTTSNNWNNDSSSIEISDGESDSDNESIESSSSDFSQNLPLNLSKNTIFIGNLPKDMSTYALGALLKSFNPIQFHLKKNYSGKSEGYGFAKFNTKEEAIQAMTELNQTKYENRDLKSSWASENSTIFVYNIDIYKPKEELFKLFRKFGEFNEAECYFKLNYALIKFFKRSDAQNAISKLQGKIFGSKPLSINWGDSIVLRTSVYIVFDHTLVNSKQIDDEKSFHRKIFDIAHKFGKTNHYHIPRKDDGSYEGFGFIHFRYSKNGERAAENMIAYFTKNTIDGVPINCSFAKKKRTKKPSSNETSPNLLSSSPPPQANSIVSNYQNNTTPPPQSHHNNIHQFNTFFPNTSHKRYSAQNSIPDMPAQAFDHNIFTYHSPTSSQQLNSSNNNNSNSNSISVNNSNTTAVGLQQINQNNTSSPNSTVSSSLQQQQQQQIQQQLSQQSVQQIVQQQQQSPSQSQQSQQNSQYMQFQYGGYRNIYSTSNVYQPQSQSPNQPPTPQYNYLPYQYQSPQDFQSPITYTQPYQPFSNFPNHSFASFINYNHGHPPPQNIANINQPQQKPYPTGASGNNGISSTINSNYLKQQQQLQQQQQSNLSNNSTPQSFKSKSPQHLDEVDLYPSSSANTPPLNNNNIFSPSSIYPYHTIQPYGNISNIKHNNHHNNYNNNSNTNNKQ